MWYYIALTWLALSYPLARNIDKEMAQGDNPLRFNIIVNLLIFVKTLNVLEHRFLMKSMFKARLFFEEKMSRYCHQPGVVVVVVSTSCRFHCKFNQHGLWGVENLSWIASAASTPNRCVCGCGEQHRLGYVDGGIRHWS